MNEKLLEAIAHAILAAAYKPTREYAAHNDWQKWREHLSAADRCLDAAALDETLTARPAGLSEQPEIPSAQPEPA